MKTIALAVDVTWGPKPTDQELNGAIQRFCETTNSRNYVCAGLEFSNLRVVQPISGEFEFIAEVEKTVTKLMKDLDDSPNSLRGHLYFWLGVLDGTCNANNWFSADRQRVFATIHSKIETLAI